MKFITLITARFMASAAICSTALSALAAQQQAAIVPGSDIVGTIAIHDLNTAPLIKNRTNTATHAITRAVAARSARLEASTGLTKDDITSALFSCNIDTYNFKAETQRERVADLNGLIAVQLAKPVSIGKIKQAIKLEYGTEELAGVANITITGNPGLIIKATKKTDPDIFITITPDKHVLLAALNSASLASALQRAKSGRIIKEPQVLARMRGSLPPKSQIKIAAIIPAEVRALINQHSKAMTRQAKQNPGMMAAAGITQLFQNIKSISLGAQLTKDLLLTVAGDLGNAQSSQQAAILMKTMVIPMMQATMAQQSPQQTPVLNLKKQVKVKSDGTDLFLQIIIPENRIFTKSTAKH
jgi:hypothetical protein